MIQNENGILINAVICDFGLARVSAESRLYNQKFSVVAGLSPRYAAPEGFFFFFFHYYFLLK